jgi:hypothetical protein
MDKYIRDTKSKAVLQTDLSGLDRYKMLRQQKIEEQTDINNMKADIIELKATVKKIIGQLNG